MAAACAREETGELVLLEDGWRVGELINSRLPSLEPDPFAMFLPSGLQVHGDTLAVLDSGNARVVLFDMDLQPLSAFGRTGEGPGELAGAADLLYRGGGYFVFDPGNQRITRFRPDGTFLSVSSVEANHSAQSFALDSRGTPYIPNSSSEHVMTRVGVEGRAEPFGERPDSLALTGGLPVTLDHAVITSGDTLHLMDRLGRLLKIDREGSLQMMRMIPQPILQRVEQDRLRTVGALTGGRPVVSFSAVAKDLSVTDQGDLLVTVSDREGIVGLVIDPATYEATVIRAPAGHALHSMGSAVLRDSTLFAVSSDGIRVYRLHRE